MPLVSRRLLLLIGLSLLVAGGCTPIREVAHKSPLHPAQMSPDSVGLDIVTVHCPFGGAADEQLWREIDEQQLPSDLRQRLAQNGFRAGVITGQIPTGLSQLIGLKDTASQGGKWETLNLDELNKEQNVSGRHLDARAGDRIEIEVSDVYPELALLMREPNGSAGGFYSNAQGIFGLTPMPQADGRVQIDLLPELHYGNYAQRFVGNNAAMRIVQERSHRVFDSLAISTSLSPGQVLVVASIPSRVGSLGHQFLTREVGGKRQQKLLLVRLAQTQHQGLFSATEPLDLAKVNQ